MIEMTKRERVMAAVKGEAVDRVPASFFVHQHVAERSSDTTTAGLLEQNRKFNWDFIKVHLRASYFGEAWDCKYRWTPEKGPQIEDYVIKSTEDIKKLKKQDPTKGVLGDQVKVAKLLGETLKGSVPYIQTVFSPLFVAGKLAGGVFGTPSDTERIKGYMKENPEALHQGLSIISQTLANYVREVIRAGADGIFFSTGVWASLDTITEAEYDNFGRPYDLAIFEAAIQEGATFNVLHICRDNIMLDYLSDYPVQVINYEAMATRNPGLKEAMTRTDKALWGGVKHDTTLLNGPAEAIAAEVQVALKDTGGRRFILGPGCSSLLQVPDAHLTAAREALEMYQGS